MALDFGLLHSKLFRNSSEAGLGFDPNNPPIETTSSTPALVLVNTAGTGTSISNDSITQTSTISITTVGATNGGTGQTTYTTGDILYSNAANSLAKLTIDSAGKILTIVGGVPTWQNPPSGTATKEIWAQATAGEANTTDITTGYYGGRKLSFTQYGGASLMIPWDFAAITSAVAVCIPSNTIASANIDTYTQYGANGQSYAIHSGTNTASTYSTTANQIIEIDISGLLTSLAAGDYMGLGVKNSDGGMTTLQFIGVRLRYT